MKKGGCIWQLTEKSVITAVAELFENDRKLKLVQVTGSSVMQTPDNLWTSKVIGSRSKELEGRNKKALIGGTEKCFFCEVIYFSAPTERIRHDTEVLVH